MAGVSEHGHAGCSRWGSDLPSAPDGGRPTDRCCCPVGTGAGRGRAGKPRIKRSLFLVVVSQGRHARVAGLLGQRRARGLAVPPPSGLPASRQGPRPTRRFTEWRPSDGGWQFGSHSGTAIGELAVRQLRHLYDYDNRTSTRVRCTLAAHFDSLACSHRRSPVQRSVQAGAQKANSYQLKFSICSRSILILKQFPGKPSPGPRRGL